jgi:8-oxo-dGTP pyrophosphatase MutT (NUDIX family)
MSDTDPSDRAGTGTAAGRVVMAAGGVVLDGTGRTARVLVVHRPAHDDWSLPKGHVDEGEALAEAALREVIEETGVTARIVQPAGTTEHAVVLDGATATKRVHWFVMEPVGTADPSTRRPDAEVDHAAWFPIGTALERLTYPGERTLLSETVALR